MLQHFERAGSIGQAADELRSSSAEISRCTPDLDLRSSASFISSNEGETPVSAQAIVDEADELMLLAREHDLIPVRNRQGTFRQCSFRLSSDVEDFRLSPASRGRRMGRADDQGSRRAASVASIGAVLVVAPAAHRPRSSARRIIGALAIGGQGGSPSGSRCAAAAADRRLPRAARPAGGEERGGDEGRNRIAGQADHQSAPSRPPSSACPGAAPRARNRSTRPPPPVRGGRDHDRPPRPRRW
jgi:hypothetical protein